MLFCITRGPQESAQHEPACAGSCQKTSTSLGGDISGNDREERATSLPSWDVPFIASSHCQVGPQYKPWHSSHPGYSHARRL